MYRINTIRLHDQLQFASSGFLPYSFHSLQSMWNYPAYRTWVAGDGLAEPSQVMIEYKKVNFEVNKLVYTTSKFQLELMGDWFWYRFLSWFGKVTGSQFLIQ